MIFSRDQFTTDDVQVIQNSITTAGDNTQLNISVTQPGSSNPVSVNVVEDAFRQPFQSNITNLTLGITNIPTLPTANEKNNAIEVRLINFSARQVS